MHYRNRFFYLCIISAASMLCGPAHAADDAAAICNAAVSAYGAAAVSGDPAKMAAVYAPDGELVSPYGIPRRTRRAAQVLRVYHEAWGQGRLHRRQRTHDRQRGAVHGRHHLQTGLGRNEVEGFLDEGARQGRRRLEASQSDLRPGGASVAPALVVVAGPALRPERFRRASVTPTAPECERSSP